MKKLFNLLIVICILLSSTGCGFNKEVRYGSSNDDRYMLGTTFDDGREILFESPVYYKGDELGMALLQEKISIGEVISKLKLVDTLRDGGSKIYHYNRASGEFGNDEFYMIVCNSGDDSNSIYVAKDKENLMDKCSMKVDDLEGVSMKIKEGTLTDVSATVIITDTSGRDNMYGNPYYIEKLDNGNWIKLKVLIDNLAWTMIGYTVGEDHTLEFKMNWEDIYGKLKKGKYRIVKDTSEAGEYPNHYITAEFTIE